MDETKPKLVTLPQAQVVSLRDLLQLIDDDPDIDLGRKDEMAERVGGALWLLDTVLQDRHPAQAATKVGWLRWSRR